MRLLVPLLLGLSWWAQAWAAAPCAERPYTLETREGLLGGGSLEYDGEVLVFGDGACLEATGLSLEAPVIRYHQAQERLAVQDLGAQTPQYRFRAQEGEVQGGVFTASGIWATTCRCGEDFRVLSKRARFETKTGRLLLEEAQVDLYGFTVARPERVELDPKDPLEFSFPLRLNYEQGWTVGLEDFPLPAEDESFGRWRTRLTLLATGLGGDPAKEKFSFGLSAREGARYASFSLTRQGGQVETRSWLTDGPLFFGHDTASKKAEAGYRDTLSAGGLSLSPFVRIAREDQTQGLSLGLEARYKLDLREGLFRLHAEPWGLAVTYDGAAPPYLAYGYALEGRYQGAFSLRLGYLRTYEEGQARFTYERRPAAETLSLGFFYSPSAGLPAQAGQEGFSLSASHEFLKRQSSGSLRYSASLEGGQAWGELWLRHTTTQGLEQQEVRLGFTPRLLDCTFAFSLAPSLGYDLLRQGFSRLGLEVRYADCCFIWKLAYQNVLIPQVGAETASTRLTLGLELR